MTIDKIPSNKSLLAFERKKRLVYLRKKILKLTQQDIEDRHGISAKSLQNWESIRYVGLTERGANQLVEAFKQEGLECTHQWLMYGEGKEPVLTTKLLGPQPLSIIDPNFRKLFPLPTSPPISSSSTINMAAIQEELKVFYKGHPTAIDTTVCDNGCAPYLQIGDQVAGEKLFDENMDKAVGYVCIIQFAQGDIVIRELCQHKKNEFYILKCTNPDANIKEVIIDKSAIFFVAPIIWIRKPEVI